MLKHVKGNLIDLAEQGEFGVIIHGCNCQNTMGSGIAREIRERYPSAYEADTLVTKCLSNQTMKLGTYSTTTASRKELPARPFTIVNAYTQVNFLPRGVDHFEYESFAVILKKLASEYGNQNIGLPYIGMGLAAGDAARIIPMIEKFAEYVEEQGGSVTLVEFAA